jgi:hypothetical protein
MAKTHHPALSFMTDRVVQIRTNFFAWVDAVLTHPIPNGTEGFHFNLYEGEDSVHIQLVGTEAFHPGEDPSTDYWPAAETFSTGENVFEVPFSVAGADWRAWLKCARELVESYIAQGTESKVLHDRKGVGLGFVDGDMYVVWQRSAV